MIFESEVVFIFSSCYGLIVGGVCLVLLVVLDVFGFECAFNVITFVLRCAVLLGVVIVVVIVVY